MDSSSRLARAHPEHDHKLNYVLLSNNLSPGYSENSWLESAKKIVKSQHEFGDMGNRTPDLFYAKEALYH